MGMSIDSTCEPKTMSKKEIVDTLKTMVFGRQAFERFNAKEREVLDKSWNLIDQYENRLKADMVAMLTDIQLEIEEKKFLESSCFFMDKTEEKNYAVYTDEISKIIQQKIDALKVESEDKDENKFKIKL